MKKTNINYPHPVLSASNEDYINCHFDLEIINDPQVNGNIITLALSYALSCPSLETLISSGDACAVAYVESPVAEYRKIFRFSSAENELTVPIDKNLVNKKIEVKIPFKSTNKVYTGKEYINKQYKKAYEYMKLIKTNKLL